MDEMISSPEFRDAVNKALCELPGVKWSPLPR